MGSIAFRRLARDDFALLRQWLAEPHVARWWNHESTAEAVERDFGPVIDGVEPSQDHVVVLDGRPVGLVQCSRFAAYPDYREELTPVVPVPPAAVTIDYLIGDPSLVGRGVGRAVLRRFTEELWLADPDASCVLVPVCSANEASWRALLAAGFRLVARGRLEPDNPIDDGWHEVLQLDRPGT